MTPVTSSHFELLILSEAFDTVNHSVDLKPPR